MGTSVAGRTAKALAAAATLAAAVLIASGGAAHASSRATAAGVKRFTNHVFASASGIMHPTANGEESISGPDDITSFGDHIFVGFQNGVGPQGEPSTTGNTDSTVVEFNLKGHRVAQWDVVGKCDGLTADPLDGRLIATVNEDAHSSVYLINPVVGSTPVHYRYNKPLPSDGGTDAISIYQKMILVSASAPGTTGAAAPSAKYPAVYRVLFNTKTHVAKITALFSDEAEAVIANATTEYGKPVHLALTDPDSNAVVPAYADRFAGAFELTSQADKEQIFLYGGKHRALAVLKLSGSVDDTAWAADASGAIYTTDSSTNTVDKVTGPFKTGEAFVAGTPCDAGNAPSTCPAPGFSANYLGKLNLMTGAIARVAVKGPALEPKGMLFLP